MDTTTSTVAVPRLAAIDTARKPVGELRRAIYSFGGGSPQDPRFGGLVAPGPLAGTPAEQPLTPSTVQ